ncbi:phage tail tape measure protein [Peribacillus frigoritolerans]|uniref:phage tail tape measure protein n=1 Tax=Peribacillus frigoritolerans TaxID=450367 RepID=UPI002E207802|nr:phage tail tape measure protein [Peribacillus frigoritolerans]MED3710036.1 phage tail tape measure protein [Peribacillus frigoritolerans]
MEKIEGLSIGLDLDTVALNRGLTGLKEKLRTVNSEMKANMSAFDRGDRSIGKYETRLSGLNRKLEVQKEVTKQAKVEYEKMVKEHGEGSKEADNAAKSYNNEVASLNNLERYVGRTREELEKLKEQQKIAKSSWGKLGKKLEETGTRLTKVGDSMKSTGKSLSMYVTAPLVGLGGMAVKSAIEFESAFAGVRKTVDATEGEYKVLEKQILNMSKILPVSANDIAAVAESAGQLGIKKSSIMDFTKTVIDLGESTNMTREQAATEFARFANIVKMPQKNFDRLGSSVVALGNNMATTESEIVDMSMRLAAQGSQVGMTESDIMALSASMSSLGIESEAGGTAMTTVLKKIDSAVGSGGKSLEEFAKASGVSAKEFKKSWESDPVKALEMFIQGLSESGKEGENLTSILGDLGIKGIRESDTILRLAGNAGLLGEAVDLSSKAWKDNTALSNEAEQRYATMASKLATVKNNIFALAKDIGDILSPYVIKAADLFNGLIEKMSGMSKQGKIAMVVLGAIVAAIGPLLVAGGMFIGILGHTATGLGKLFPSIAKAGGLLKWLRLGFTALTGPVGLTIGILALLATGVVIAYKKFEPFRNAINKWKDVFVSSFKIIADYFKSKISEMKAFWDSNGKQLLDAFRNIFNGILFVIKPMMPILEAIFKVTFTVILEIVKSVIGNIKGVIDGGLKVIMGLIQVFSGLFTGNFSKMWTGIKNIFSGSIQFIWNFVQLMFWGKVLKGILSLGKLMINAFKGMWGSIKNVFSTVIKWIVDFVKNRFTAIKNTVNTMTTTIKKLISTIWNGILNFFKLVIKSIVDLVKSRFTNLKNNINTIFSGIRNLTKTIWNAIKDSIYTPIKNAVTNTLSRFSNLKSSISGIFGTIKKNVKGYVSDMVNAVKGMPQKMADGISKGKTALANGAKKLGNGLISGVGWGVNKALDGIDWVLGKLGSKKRLGNWEVPQFAKGTPNGGHKGGLARIGDGNKHELVALPNGQMFISPNRDTLVNLPKGTEVLSGEKTSQLFGGRVPAFAKGTGGWLDNLVSDTKNAFNKVKDWGADIWDWVKDKSSIGKLLANKISSYGMGNLSGIPTELAKGSITKAIDAGKSMLFGEVGDSGGAAPAGKGVERWRNTVKKALAMNKLPTSANYVNAWLRQIKSESGGNEKAIQSTAVKDVNYYSGNLARGLVQVIPPTFRAYAFPGHKNQMNGLDSLLAGMNYAKSRYGSNMLKYIGHGHGYATGGLINHAGMYNLAEDGWPEFVIPTNPSKRTDAMKLLALAGKTVDKENKRPGQLPNVGTASVEGDNVLQKLLEATLEQTKVLLQLLSKDPNIILDGPSLAKGIHKEVTKYQTQEKRISKRSIKGKVRK